MMRKTYLLLICCLSLQVLPAQDLDLQKLVSKYRYSDTTVFLYMTALWCKPCLEKMPVLDAYFSGTDRPYKLFYLFDREDFEQSKLARIFPHIVFADKLVFMPQLFYSKAVVQVNGHKKMFSNFISAHQSFEPRIDYLETFNLSSLLIIRPNGKIIVKDAPVTKGITRAQLNDALDKILVSPK